MKRALHILRQIDRHLPALLFAVLFSMQGLLAAGAADSIVLPELVGPDGRALTFADICNTAGSDDAERHCKDCSLHGGTLLPDSNSVSFCPDLASRSSLPSPARVLPNTPERWQYHRRGPPLS